MSMKIYSENSTASFWERIPRSQLEPHQIAVSEDDELCRFGGGRCDCHRFTPQGHCQGLTEKMTNHNCRFFFSFGPLSGKCESMRQHENTKT
jgi:hypothetical protein